MTTGRGLNFELLKSVLKLGLTSSYLVVEFELSTFQPPDSQMLLHVSCIFPQTYLMLRFSFSLSIARGVSWQARKRVCRQCGRKKMDGNGSGGNCVQRLFCVYVFVWDNCSVQRSPFCVISLLRVIPTMIFQDVHVDIYSDILSALVFGIYGDIYSDILAGILSGKMSEFVSKYMSWKVMKGITCSKVLCMITDWCVLSSRLRSPALFQVTPSSFIAGPPV